MLESFISVWLIPERIFDYISDIRFADLFVSSVTACSS